MCEHEREAWNGPRVSLTRVSDVFPVGLVAMRNRAVEYNVAAFSELYAGRECYAEASTTSNSANRTASW